MSLWLIYFILHVSFMAICYGLIFFFIKPQKKLDYAIGDMIIASTLFPIFPMSIACFICSLTYDKKRDGTKWNIESPDNMSHLPKLLFYIGILGAMLTVMPPFWVVFALFAVTGYMVEFFIYALPAWWGLCAICVFAAYTINCRTKSVTKTIINAVDCYDFCDSCNRSQGKFRSNNNEDYEQQKAELIGLKCVFCGGNLISHKGNIK